MCKALRTERNIRRAADIFEIGAIRRCHADLFRETAAALARRCCTTGRNLSIMDPRAEYRTAWRRKQAYRILLGTRSTALLIDNDSGAAGISHCRPAASLEPMASPDLTR